MPLRKVNDVKQVEPGTKSGDTAADTGREHDHAPRAAAARDITALRREMERRDLPAGPPPSFQVSKLEVAADIKQIIARVEAARAQAREADALKAEAKTEERLAEAEIDRLAATEAAGRQDPGPLAVDAQFAAAGGMAGPDARAARLDTEV